jgi:hypothetical protein
LDGGGSGDRRRRLHSIQEPDHDVEHGVAVVFVEHVVQVASRFRWADADWVVLPVGAWWWS